MTPPANVKYSVRTQVRELGVPPIHNALVIGNRAATRKAVGFLVASPFGHFEIKNEIIGDVIVRNATLRRMPEEKLIAFILPQVKPLATAGRDPASRSGSRDTDGRK